MVTQAQVGEVEDVLDLFKAAQEQDTAALLWFKSSRDVMAMILAWSKVPAKLKVCGTKVPKDLVERWAWLWKNYEFSVIEWCDLAGVVDYRYGTRLASRIIRLRLIFPDNTYAKWLEQYITLSALHATTKKSPKKEKGKAGKVSGLPPELSDDDDDDDDTVIGFGRP